MDFPGITTGKESSCQCRRLRGADSIPGSERSPGAGNCTLLQYSCLENPMDRGTRWATVHRTTMYGLCDSQCESEMTERTQTPYGLSQEIGYNSLCYTIRPGYIPILYIIVCIYQPPNPSPSCFLSSLPLGNHKSDR